MNLKERCKYLKLQLDIEKHYKNRNKLGFSQIKVLCPICNYETNINGVTAHSKKHAQIIFKKKLAILKFVYGEQIIYNCVICNKELNHFNNKGSFNQNNIITCSSQCAIKLKWQVYAIQNRYKICPVCKKQHTNHYKCCSIKCGNKLSAEATKIWHQKYKNSQKYKIMYNQISNSVKKSKDGVYYPAWNKGLSGEQYIKHYDKFDGTNSLYQSIKRNTQYFKKTKPEQIFEILLQQLNIQFDYNIFVNNKQFDFLLKIGQEKIVVQIDGDWWHKSILRCSDIKQRNVTRLADTLKQQILLKNRIGWYIIRVWEMDLYNDYNCIKSYIKQIKEYIIENNLEQYRNKLSEVKKYYLKKG